MPQALGRSAFKLQCTRKRRGLSTWEPQLSKIGVVNKLLWIPGRKGRAITAKAAKFIKLVRLFLLTCNLSFLAKSMAQTTLRLEYSAFFSSGLLAPHTPQKKNKVNSSSFSWDVTFDHSPSRASSPIPIPDESFMDIDTASYNDRSITPTPQSITPMQSPQPVKIQTTTTTQQPKLRKRRSSLTLATSPMSTIRSPTRAANNALHLQRQLFTALGPASPSRSRSGSLTGDDATASRYSNAGVASTETSLGGRLMTRSGSVGCVLPPSGPLRYLFSLYYYYYTLSYLIA